MPDFVPHALDPCAAQAEVAEFQTLLDSHPHLKEAALREFFRSRPHASALIGPYTPLVKRIDLLAYEYPLFGDFRCDLVIADSITPHLHLRRVRRRGSSQSVRQARRQVHAGMESALRARVLPGRRTGSTRSRT